MASQVHLLRRHVKELQALVEGRVSPEEWLTWWEQHQEEIADTCPSGIFLRLKPRGIDQSANQAVSSSQKGARQVLDLLGVSYTVSDRYHVQWRSEFEQTRHNESQIATHKAVEFEPMITCFAEHFPRFGRFVRDNITEVNRIEPGLSDMAVAKLEKALALRLPVSYRRFLQCASEIVLGEALQMTSTHPFLHHAMSTAMPSSGMLCIADHWLEADGDQVLFDRHTALEHDPPVFYYAHTQGTIRPLAASFTSWLEAMPRILAD